MKTCGKPLERSWRPRQDLSWIPTIAAGVPIEREVPRTAAVTFILSGHRPTTVSMPALAGDAGILRGVGRRPPAAAIFLLGVYVLGLCREGKGRRAKAAIKAGATALCSAAFDHGWTGIKLQLAGRGRHPGLDTALELLQPDIVMDCAGATAVIGDLLGRAAPGVIMCLPGVSRCPVTRSM